MIEYRSIQRAEPNKIDQDALLLFSQVSKIGGSFIADDARVLDIIPNGKNSGKVTGVLSEMPLVPAFQRMSIERFLDMYFKKIK